jgi:GNAT superfamily N-acetyltransferase
MRIETLSPRHGTAWSELFAACASPCHCRYWHFAGSKNDWLARCAHDPGENRLEQLASLSAGEDVARGLLALEGEVAVGFMKLAPRAAMRKLTRLPVYRAYDPTDPAGVYVIGCLLVRPGHRRRGVGRALVAAADEHVLAWGGRSIEAYPRTSAAPLHDEEAFMGPERVFLDAGYAVTAGEAPYCVYRKSLTRASIT